MNKLFKNRNSVNNELLSKYVGISKLFDHIVPQKHCFYTYNHSTLQYEFISQGLAAVTGYSKSEYNTLLNNGLSSLCHPDDAVIIKNLLFDDIEKITSSFSYEQKTQLKFQYNFRLIRKDQRIINVLKQHTYIEVDSEGEPLLSFGCCSQIPFNDGPYRCGLSIYLMSDTDSDLVFQKFYDPEDDTLNGVSNREKEVLELLINGLTSREIGEKLHISKNTVDNHRRRLLEKFGVRRTNDLLRIAIKEKLQV